MQNVSCSYPYHFCVNTPVSPRCQPVGLTPPGVSSMRQRGPWHETALLWTQAGCVSERRKYQGNIVWNGTRNRAEACRFEAPEFIFQGPYQLYEASFQGTRSHHVKIGLQSRCLLACLKGKVRIHRYTRLRAVEQKH
eukprot:1152862-Pelagomonas_calceolata.AAC.1